MRLEAIATRILTLLLALGASGACSTRVEGGSETNWLCTTDSDCAGGKVCVAKTCVVADGGGAGRSGAEAGAGTSGSSGGSIGGGGARTNGNGGNAGSVSTDSTTVFTDAVMAIKCVPGECLQGRCLPLVVDRDSNGQVSCVVLDATPPAADGGTCNCGQPGLQNADAKDQTAALDYLRGVGICDAPSSPACNDLCLCAETQLSGAALQSCRHDLTLPADATGWCYVDRADSTAIVSQCPGTEPQILRLPSSSRPAHTVFMSCTATSAASTSPATGTGQVGDPFVPAEESKTDFNGFSANEVSIETNSPSCASGVGLVNGFAGRVTCPYGQDTGASSNVGQTCTTPSGAAVTVPVPSQLSSRRPSKAVYCSCLCGGEGAASVYCACPSGFECTPLIPDYGFGSTLPVGSYCVKTGTLFRPGVDDAAPKCDTSLMNCGPL